MRKYLLSLFIGTLFLPTSIPLSAANTYYSLLQEVELLNAIRDIGNRYNVHFTYDRDVVENIRVNHYQPEKYEDVNEALESVLEGTKLKYVTLEERYLVIYRDDEAGMESLQKMIGIMEQIIEQKEDSRKISSVQKLSSHKPLEKFYRDRYLMLLDLQGTVTDQSGMPLIGVNVIVKGTNKGTATDIDGNFYLEDINKNAILVFSYIGYQGQEVVLNGRSSVAVTLIEDAQSLEEVIVVGYGTSQKKDLTGAVARVNLDQNRLQPNVNPIQNLRGTVAGVNVVDNGRPGSDASIIIRGRNSISASNSPLIVLDGVIYSGGSLSDINSNDIASIDILKDASASAIYGSLAANGVILITTKKGTTEKPRISYNAYYGRSDFAHVPRFLDAEKYLEVRRDAEIADGGPIPFNPLEQANMNAGKTIEPFEEIRQQAPVYSNELSVSGRGSSFTYYFSGSHTSLKSPVMGDNFERIAGRVNLSVDIADWLTVGTNLGYSAKDNSGNRANLGSAGYLSPYADLYYEDGVPRPLPMNVGLINNPLTATLLYDNLDKTNTLFTNTFAEVKLPVRGLSFRLNTGYTQSNRKALNYIPSFNREAFFNLGSGSQSFSESKNLTVENILRYDRVIANDHVFNLTLLYGIYESRGESAFLSSENIFNDALGYNALEIGENFNINTGAGEDQQLSTMGRIGYRYKGRYIVNATIRRDGYSAFGQGNKYGIFPSAGLSWIVSEEGFMSGINFIDNLKLRVSWGKNGNRGVSRYSSLSNVSQTNYVFGDGAAPAVGLYTSSLGNPNLGWETTTSTNVGLDFELFSYRLTGSLEFYHTNTYDLLLRQQIPNISGFTSFLRNIGETENRGVELALNTVNIQKNDFSWQTSIAFSLNRNKILRLTGNDFNGDGIEDDDISSGWFIGYPLGANFDYVFDGIYQEGEDFSLQPGAKPGYIKFKDINGDGAITPADRQVVGSDQADFLTGITNTFSYKGLSLMVMFNIRQGGESPNQILNLGRNFYYEANILDTPYWMPDNPINTAPIINYPDPLGYGFYQSRSFVRLQDVSLSYDLPPSLLQSINLTALKVYLSGKNLATWTDWNGWDPENGMTGRSGSNNGPVIRSLTFGLNIQL